MSVNFASLNFPSGISSSRCHLADFVSFIQMNWHGCLFHLPGGQHRPADDWRSINVAREISPFYASSLRA
jgi:hypothetical protein